MENTQTAVIPRSENAFAFDTTFVLFFLSMDVGQRGFLSVDGAVMGIALAAVMLMPYLLETRDDVSFRHWAAGRGVIAVFGVIAGLAFSASVGTVFPQVLGSVPFTLLMVASIVSCFLAFGSGMGFRFSR